MKKILLFIISLTFFSFLVFILGNYFFSGGEEYKNKIIEEKYIEPTVEKNYIDRVEEVKKNNENEKIRVSLKSAYKIRFLYFPFEFKLKMNDYTNNFKYFLNNTAVKEKIDTLKIELHEDKNDVRGKMKNRSIKLYGPQFIDLGECLSVLIHEFGHFIDLYFLKKEVFKDTSEYFYDISWGATKVLKPGMKQSDFVSGYAMTNKYEDFAESFTYFVLHNKDYFEKTKKSAILKKKYDFFTKNIFRNKEFIETDFSIDNDIKNYYRDITKIDFSLENFLEFLKK